VNSLNTIGAFKRARADRAIEHAGGDEFDRQRRQIERDLENMDWLIQSCDEALAIFRAALERVDAKAPRTTSTPTRRSAAVFAAAV
jgi:hypothetical protein